MDFESYLDALASAEPTPGGGSAATLVGALAVALCAMVARITQRSAKLAPVHEEAAAIAADADVLRGRFLALRTRDETAFAAVVAAQALPRGTEAERAGRTERLQATLLAAAEAPLEATGLATDTFKLAARTAELGNANLMSDVDCALRFARAAFDAAVVNVEVNHHYIKDELTVRRQRDRLAVLAGAAREAELRAAAVARARPAP